MKNIVLIGMPGCGKSAIGEILAEKIEMTFLDIDTYIESSTKLTITEMFKNGEDGFRDIEAALASISLNPSSPFLNISVMVSFVLDSIYVSMSKNVISIFSASISPIALLPQPGIPIKTIF